MTGSFGDAQARIAPLDQSAQADARALLDRLTKPPGSLGRLEDLAAQLAAIAGVCPPPIPEPAAVAIFAGDHGVLAEGVTPWPAEVTAQMVANFLAGGAAVNVLSRQVAAEVIVVDVGVASEIEGAPGLISAKVRAGTANLADEPAMSRDEAGQALDAGASVATSLLDRGMRCLLTGDMGIGNTTPSAALIAAFTGHPATDVTGRGTGIDDDHLRNKISAIEAGLLRTFTTVASGPGDPAERSAKDPLAVLASLGGLEIAALAGYITAGASRRVPVVIDGVIALAGALVAEALSPGISGYMIAGHLSTEPGAAVALQHLGLSPIVDLSMRLGEGTGACLALPMVQAASRILSEMATFDAAGVTDKSGSG